MRNEELVGEKFSREAYLDAREVARRLTLEAAEQIRPGMTEKEGHDLLKKAFAENKVAKLWHPSKVRFGINTIKNFSEPSVEGVVLAANDIFFLDIGPVWADHEGDYGETFVVGHHPQHEALARAAKEVFLASEQAWLKEKLTGAALYEVASKEADMRGFRLNMGMDGHRLADFPHALFYKGGLADFDTAPAAGLWVLEIHLTTQDGNYGAFYEDILGVQDLGGGKHY